MILNDINSLAYTKFNCKYHTVFAHKYISKVFYKKKILVVGKILSNLCEWKEVKIIQAEVSPDSLHMLLEISTKYSISSFMVYLIFERH